ncbi:MAG: sigma-70 family RNA polymerase sigma factor, partial [Actinomycetota bacterium]
ESCTRLEGDGERLGGNVVGTRCANIAAETFTVAFESRTRFDTGHSSALPWLIGIAVNLVRRDLRTRGRSIAALERAHRRDTPPAAADTGADERIDAEADAAALRTALVDLSESERDVFLLVAWDQLSPHEAATALGITSEAARTRLRRARQRLRHHLDEQQTTSTEVRTDG